jgi:DNA-binding GntR family transcriptional regulator
LNTKGASPEWDRLHRAFHRALIMACDSRLLVDFADSLFDRAARYRHLASSITVETRDVAGEHRAIAEAAIDRDANRAIDLLGEHFSRTMNIARAFAAPGGKQPSKRRTATVPSPS